MLTAKDFSVIKPAVKRVQGSNQRFLKLSKISTMQCRCQRDEKVSVYAVNMDRSKDRWNTLKKNFNVSGIIILKRAPVQSTGNIAKNIGKSRNSWILSQTKGGETVIERLKTRLGAVKAYEGAMPTGLLLANIPCNSTEDKDLATASPQKL